MSSSLEGRSLGNYQILEMLGQGGMATVYVGYQQTVDRKVAVKVLPPHPGINSQFVERFQQEARTIAKLQHPHILPLYDYGNQDDILYLVMAYVEGGSLEDHIAQGPLPLQQTEKFLREIAGALDYAHRQDVIHRDIKPGNILIDSEGHALLADFGIAKLAKDTANLTGTGVVGTPAYMSPEQAQGLEINGRTDIYALGVVAYEMLTGRQPFEADTLMQVMIKVMQEPAPDILQVRPDLPAALGEVMARVLIKDPRERYQTATEFAEALRAAIAGADEPARIAGKMTDSDIDNTKPFGVGMPTTRLRASTNPTGTSITSDTGQTIILQQGPSTLLILGAVAIIAIAAVVVVLLLINNNGGDDEPGIAFNPTTVRALATRIGERNDATDEINIDATLENIQEMVAIGEVDVVGQISYSNTNSTGDSLSLRVEELPPPGANRSYMAWLINTEDDSVLPLGTFTPDPLGSATLSFVDEAGQLLPAFFNAMLITIEVAGENPEAPGDEIAYRGSIPVEIMLALREILVASDDGLNGDSLLAGALQEANSASQHAGLAANASNIGGVQTHAEHTINILRGEDEDYNGNGRGENPGRGVGVFAFLDLMETALQTGIDAAPPGSDIQVNVESVRVCLQNSRLRANRIVELETELFAVETLEAGQAQLIESTQIADALISGDDLNENGVVDPFENECGLEQVATYAVLAGRIAITAGTLE